MNNKLLPFVLAALFTAGLAQSLPATRANSVSLTATGSFVSNYMFRGLRLSSGGFEPSVEMSSGALTLGAWSNWPFDPGKVPDSSDPEVDLYGSYDLAMGPTASLAPGFTFYGFPDAPTRAGFYRSRFEPNVAFNYTVAGVKLTPKIYYDLALDGPTYELNATSALPLGGIGTELDLIATAGTYEWKDSANKAAPDVKAWGDYWLLGASVPFSIGPRQKITLGFAYTEGRRAFTKQGGLPRSVNALAVGRGVASISYAYSF